MKKAVLLVSILSLSILISNAQKKEFMTLRYKYMWGYFGIWGGSKEYNEKISKAGISGYVETVKKGDKEYVSAKNTCDKSGNTLSYVYFRKNGNPVAQYAYSYNADTNIISQSYKRKKDLEIKKINLSYDEFKNTACEEYFKKGKPKAKTIFKYDSTKILESYYYKNSSPDYKRKWVYTYYPDKSKKSSVIYKANGKVKYTWNYECKPEGELQSKHKDTTDVCKKVEFDSLGNKTITVRKFDETGKVIRVVSVFNKEDKIIQYATYNSKDMCTYSYKCDPKSLKVIEVIYYRKGKENYKYESVYDNNNNLISMTGLKKGEQVNRSEYHYDTGNFLTSYSWYGKKNKLSSAHTCKYSFF